MLTARADALFEVADSVLCADGPVRTLVGPSLAPEHRRGHGRCMTRFAALEPGRTSWTGVLDAVRLGPHDDETAVTAAQVREVIERLVAAGHWQPGAPDILIVFHAGYDVTRLAWLLADLPAELCGRLRSDRVLYFPAPPRTGGTGRPSRHGRELRLADEESGPSPR